MRWRFTQVEDQHTVDSTQHLCLTAFQIRHFFAFGGHVAQLESELFQLKSDEVAHARGVLAAVGLDHHLRRDNAVFHQQVGYACELATVADRILEQPLDHLVVLRLLAGIDDALKEEIGFFQLIPEERVVLRELELAHVVFRDGFRTEDIKSGEEPASSG